MCINRVKAECGRGEAAAAPCRRVQPLPKDKQEHERMRTPRHWPSAGVSGSVYPLVSPGPSQPKFLTRVDVRAHVHAHTHASLSGLSGSWHGVPGPSSRLWSSHPFPQTSGLLDPWIADRLPDSPARPGGRSLVTCPDPRTVTSPVGGRRARTAP